MNDRDFDGTRLCFSKDFDDCSLMIRNNAENDCQINSLSTTTRKPMNNIRHPKPYRARSAVVVSFALMGVTIGTISQISFDQTRTFIGRGRHRIEKSSNLVPTISEQTTYLTNPVMPDGRIDYFSAVNLQFSRRTTPENNAAACFAKLGIGIADLPPEQLAQVCHLLGVESPMTKAGWFQFLNDPDEQFLTNLMTAKSQPWAAETAPKLYGWISSNTAALQSVIEGTHLPHYWAPILRFDQTTRLRDAFLTMHDDCGEIAQCLAARAMNHLHQKDLRGAEKDLLACHRLGRLVSGSPFFTPLAMGMGIDHIAGQGDKALLEYARLSAAEAMTYQRKLRELPPLPLAIDNLDFAERLAILDAVSSLDHSSRVQLQFGANRPELNADAIRQTMLDSTLRVCNEKLDKFAAAVRLPTFSERSKATASLMVSLESEMDAAGHRLKSGFEYKTEEELGHDIAIIHLWLNLPPIGTLLILETRAQMRHELLLIGFALAAYRADHSTFPESLDALCPDYLSVVPTDLYRDQPMTYRKDGDSYFLYCTGANGIDDKGQAANSIDSEDDVALHVIYR